MAQGGMVIRFNPQKIGLPKRTTVALSLQNLAMSLFIQGELLAAQELVEESVALGAELAQFELT